MTTIASTIYKAVDVESQDGVKHQVTNWCATHEELVDSFINEGLYTHVIFTDGSAINFDDYSVSVAE